MIRKVILVFKTHFDIGFTDLSENVIRNYAGTMLDRVLDVCERTESWGNQHYVWTLPSWPLTKMLELCTTEKRERLERCIDSGQIFWHALPFTTHTDFADEEEYLEGLRYGKVLSERYGKPYPISAKMTDVPGHGLMLPDLLVCSGIRFLHLGCNDFSMPPAVPDFFWWRAPSGRKLLTMYHRGGYGSGRAPENWPFPVWMKLVMTQDNLGPDSAEEYANVLNETRAEFPEADIVCGTMDDFCREINICDLSGIPVVRKDLADTWIHGIGSYPSEVSSIRESRRREQAIQKYAAITAPDLLQQRYSETAPYYESMQLFAEHTWGADVKTWLDPAGRVYEKHAFEQARVRPGYQFMEKSWNEQRKRAKNCSDIVQKICDAVADRQQSYLFNPNNVEYTGWYFGEKPVFVKALPPFSTIEYTSENDVYQAAGTSGGTVVSRIHVREEENGIREASNGRFALYWNKEGKILTLQDLVKEQVLLESHGSAGAIDYQYIKCGSKRLNDFLRGYAYRYSIWGIQDFGRNQYPECETEVFLPKLSSWAVERDRILFVYDNTSGESHTKYGDAAQITISVTLPEEGEDIPITVELQNKAASPYVESGSLFLGLPPSRKRILINKNGTVIHPERDIETGANHCFYAVEKFAAAEGADGFGTCVIPLDTPLLSIGEDELYHYRKKYRKHDNILCFNLFNNMWGTNFPQWIEGNFTYRFLVRGYSAGEEEQLYQSCVSAADGLIPVSHPVNRLLRPSIDSDMQILNIRPAAAGDRNSFLVICRNLTGNSGKGAFAWPGYEIADADYYGRLHTDFCKQHAFHKTPYGMHIFCVRPCKSEFMQKGDKT